MKIEVLAWKWGTPDAAIVLRAGAVVRWEHCLTPAPPSAAEYAAAEAEYVAQEAGSAPMSKLALRRALRARGLEVALDALLAADAQAARDWADAQTLRLDDPLLQAALPVFRQQAGLTDADIADLVQAARA